MKAPRLWVDEQGLFFEQDQDKGSTGYVDVQFNADGSCTFETDNGVKRLDRDNYEYSIDTAFTVPAEHVDDFFAALEELIQARQRAYETAKLSLESQNSRKELSKP